MKALIPITTLLLLGTVTRVYGACPTATSVCTDYCDIANENDTNESCSATTKAYYGEYGAVVSCTSCFSGYTKTQHSIALSSTCTVSYYSCDEPCTGCTNCGTEAWTAGNTGYEKRSVGTCECSTCMWDTEYRCAAGYYGASTNGTSGCTRCPSSGGVYGTSAAGSTAITSCYIPANSSMTDSTGTYTFTTNCYYTN